MRVWDRNNAYYYQLMSSLARHYNFNLGTLFDELSDDVIKVLLYGSRSTTIDFSYISNSGKSMVRSDSFKGIIPNMQRRYHETESRNVREELAKFYTVRVCPDCGGARLTKVARHVFVDGTTLPEVISMPVGGAKYFF